jgi:EAL domain-containing protein (putative c-di-GMP-specific phosphodiesterase class I)
MIRSRRRQEASIQYQEAPDIRKKRVALKLFILDQLEEIEPMTLIPAFKEKGSIINLVALQFVDSIREAIHKAADNNIITPEEHIPLSHNASNLRVHVQDGDPINQAIAFIQTVGGLISEMVLG